MKQEYRIALEACDDYTEFYLDLTDEQAKVLRMVGAVSRRTSDYRCKPVLLMEVSR